MAEADYEDSASWAAINVTMSQEEDMHHISHGDRQWLFHASLRLQIIDCALPGLKEFDEAKRLEIGSDYCRFIEHGLVSLNEWVGWKEYEQAQKELQGSSKVKEEPASPASPAPPTPSVPPVPAVPAAAARSSSSIKTAKSGNIPGDTSVTVPTQTQDPANSSVKAKIENDVGSNSPTITRLPPPIPERPRPGPRPAIASRATPHGNSQQPQEPQSSRISIASVPRSSISEPGVINSSVHDGKEASVKQVQTVSTNPQVTAVEENVDVSSWSQDATFRTYESLVNAFVTVVTFFSAVFLEQEPTSISEFTAGNPAFPAALVFKILSMWLSLHCLAKPPMVTRSMLPAYNLLEMVRALPKPIDFKDANEPLAAYKSHVFGAVFSGEGLVLIGNVELIRTWDIASHLYFDRPNCRLYIYITGAFCYSQNRACDAQNVSSKAEWRLPQGDYRQPEVPTPTPIPLKYTQEISRTLTILFDKTSKGRKIFRDFQKPFRDLKPLMPPMRMRSRRLGPLWTEEGKHSISNQYFNSSHRALGRSTYHLDNFPYFAERLLILERYLDEVRPSGFRQLLRDSRDQLQYYTFVVAFIVFILTVIGLILSILQTIASFMQVSLAMKDSG